MCLAAVDVCSSREVENIRRLLQMMHRCFVDSSSTFRRPFVDFSSIFLRLCFDLSWTLLGLFLDFSSTLLRFSFNFTSTFLPLFSYFLRPFLELSSTCRRLSSACLMEHASSGTASLARLQIHPKTDRWYPRFVWPGSRGTLWPCARAFGERSFCFLWKSLVGAH